MRKFKLLTDQGYPKSDGWEVGKIYNGNYRSSDISGSNIISRSVQEMSEIFRNDWVEVFEHEEQKPTLHKDTDLGYFAGLVFTKLFDKSVFYIEQHGTSEWMDELIDHSIFIAKQIIEKLDKEE